MANPNPDTSGLKKPWAKGQSGNPNGRPKGAKGFAERIRKATKDGDDVIAVVVSILHKESERSSDRINAAKFLINYMIGKPQENLDITSDGDKVFNWDNLTKKEIKLVYDAVRKLTRSA